MLENGQEIKILEKKLKSQKLKNVCHKVKGQYFDRFFFANILTLIVLIDSTKKRLGYRRACWVTFENFEIFRFLSGPNGGFP